MTFAADLHLHSSYAYATSSFLTLNNLVHWARLKGIDLLATADFTHPTWFEELQSSLTEGPDGLCTYEGMSFVLGTELSCVYRQDGKGRRIHVLVYVPSLAAAKKLTKMLSRHGNVTSDGRPTLNLSLPELCHLALDSDPDTLIVPAHAWTPWYGLFGSKSGFDSLGDAFGDMGRHIPAIETGLSSDPGMNWSVPELKDKTIVSFSDAHSLPKLGRELTVFEGDLSFSGLAKGLQQNRIAYTVEMYPEEGKYHYDGHRKCGIAHHPSATLEGGSECPRCGRPLTLGVLHRILSLGNGNPELDAPGQSKLGGSSFSAAFVSSQERPPFVRLVPLLDIISALRKRGPNTKGVRAEYLDVVTKLGSELRASLWATEDELERQAGEELGRAIMQNRRGELEIEPGYDGVYGKVSLASGSNLRQHD